MLAILDDQLQPLPNPYDDGAVFHGNSYYVKMKLCNKTKTLFKGDDIQNSSNPNDSFVNEDVIPDAFPDVTAAPDIPIQIRKAKQKTKRLLTSENLKRNYFKIKCETARFQLKSIKLQHALDIKIKREQLQYYKNLNIQNN